MRTQPTASPIIDWENILNEKERIIVDISTELAFYQDKLHEAETYIREFQNIHQEISNLPQESTYTHESSAQREEPIENERISSMNAEIEERMATLIQENSAVIE